MTSRNKKIKISKDFFLRMTRLDSGRAHLWRVWGHTYMSLWISTCSLQGPEIYSNKTPGMMQTLASLQYMYQLVILSKYFSVFLDIAKQILFSC